MTTTQTLETGPSAEHRHVAAQQFERARQAAGAHRPDYDYAIELLRTCCKLDPANLIYRQTLRRIQKAKFKNNLRGSPMAWLTNSRAKMRLGQAKASRKYLQVLEYGEEILSRNPWDTAVQLDMARAAERLGLLDVAAFILDQARQKNPKDPKVNRAFAQVLERQGHYTQAIAAWDLVAKALPHDEEAGRKGKDLAATHTILKGQYEEAARGGERQPGPREAPVEKAEAAALRDTGSNLQALTAADPLQRQLAPLQAKITADPTNPHPYLQMASILRRTQQYDKARKVLEDGLAATGQNFELQIELAELETEPFRANLRIVEDQLRTNPQDEGLRKHRLRLAREINARELEVYRKRADRFPTDLSYRLELGARLLRAHQVDEAIQELQLARKDPRNRWQALLQLGFCFRAKKNLSLARRNFEESLQAMPATEEEGRKELLYQLARLAAEEGDWAAAVQVGNDLANLDFSFRDIGRLLDEWQARARQAKAEQARAESPRPEQARAE